MRAKRMSIETATRTTHNRTLGTIVGDGRRVSIYCDGAEILRIEATEFGSGNVFETAGQRWKNQRTSMGERTRYLQVQP